MSHLRHVIDVDPWLLHGNNDAPLTGRVLVRAGCPRCRRAARMALWAGVWSVEHNHGKPWTAHLIALGSTDGAATTVPVHGVTADLGHVTDQVLAASLAEAAIR